MKEILGIIDAFNRVRQTHKQAALATLVHAEGSSYRRSGARMLITEDGQLSGDNGAKEIIEKYNNTAIVPFKKGNTA